MKQTDIMVLLSAERKPLPVTVKGYATLTPGLFVHRAAYTEKGEVKQEAGPDCWNVSHS